MSLHACTARRAERDGVCIIEKLDLVLGDLSPDVQHEDGRDEEQRHHQNGHGSTEKQNQGQHEPQEKAGS